MSKCVAWQLSHNPDVIVDVCIIILQITNLKGTFK